MNIIKGGVTAAKGFKAAGCEAQIKYKNGKKDMSDKLKLKGHMKAFMRWPLILSALLIVLNIWVYFVSVKAGIIVSGGILIYVGCAVIILRCHRPFIVNELIAFANQYDSLEKRILEELALPYAIMDMNGRMIWSNKVFAELTGKDQFYKKNVSTVFPDVTADKLPVADKKETAEISTRFGEKTYRISMQRVSLGEVVAKSEFLENSNRNVSLIAMYLYDDTELKSYIKKNEDNKLVVALAYLDNYEEALESVEDVRRSLLIALIDRKITKYFSNFDGLVKKLEKDKYFLIMRQSSLEALKEQRFHILDEVKTVNIGNEMAITLSIGVGLNASTYIQNYEYSRIAIEMALGRGGDQAVIKDGEKIYYYGGKSQQMEKNTRVKVRVKAHALRQILEANDNVLIMGHNLPDIDSFGSALGIYIIAKKFGKEAHIVFGEISSSVRPFMNRFIDKEEYPDDMFIKKEEAENYLTASTVVIVVDVNRPQRTECPQLLDKCKTIIVFDHHRRSSDTITGAVLSYVDPYASSACEMVTEMIQYVDDGIKLKAFEADALYAGISIDTDGFNSKSGPRTFEAAAFLRRHGADVTRVRKMLRNDMNEYKAIASAVSKSEVYKSAFAITVFDGEGLESPTIGGAKAANQLLDISGIKASFVITQYEDKLYISARSIDEVNVQLVMEKLGGGGHMSIAGAQLTNCTIQQAVNTIKLTLDNMLAEGEI